MAGSGLLQGRHGVTEMSETAVFCSAAAAATFGLSFVPYGQGRYATHAADAWLLDVAISDAFGLLGRFAKPRGGLPPAETPV